MIRRIWDYPPIISFYLCFSILPTFLIILPDSSLTPLRQDSLNQPELGSGCNSTNVPKSTGSIPSIHSSSSEPDSSIGCKLTDNIWRIIVAPLDFDNVRACRPRYRPPFTSDSRRGPALFRELRRQAMPFKDHDCVNS